jgi:hypothetical protein
MARRKGGKGFSFGGGMPGGLDVGGMKGGLAGKIQAMQRQMLEVQESLENKTVEVSTGGGVVSVVMNGHHKLVSITIDPEVVDPEDVDVLQDLIVSVVNQAVEESQKLASEQMEGITSGLDIPGLSGLF